MIRSIFTIDVEEYFCVTAFENIIPSSRWNTYPPRVDANVMYLLDAMGRRDAKGTFFVLGWLAERNPSIVKRIAAAGHEVACHGYSHKRIHQITRRGFLEDVRRGKSILEDILGIDVLGYRAPSFSVTKETAWALDVLCEEGFLYDSSVFPVYRGSYGIPGASRHIGKICLSNGGSMYEVPLTCIGRSWCRVPVGGGAYLRWFPFRFTAWAFRKIVEEEKMPFVLYVHPWEFDLNHPDVDGIGWFTRQRHYRGIRENREKIERLLDAYPFGGVMDHIRMRFGE